MHAGLAPAAGCACCPMSAGQSAWDRLFEVLLCRDRFALCQAWAYALPCNARQAGLGCVLVTVQTLAAFLGG